HSSPSPHGAGTFARPVQGWRLHRNPGRSTLRSGAGPGEHQAGQARRCPVRAVPQRPPHVHPHQLCRDTKPAAGGDPGAERERGHHLRRNTDQRGIRAIAAGGARQREGRSMKQTQLLPGMPITIEVIDAQAPADIFNRVFTHFSSVDQIFSTYKPSSEISRINNREIAIEQASQDSGLSPTWKENVGRITPQLIQSQVADHLDCMYYISGPQTMVDSFKRALSEMGINSSQIKTGLFSGLA